MAGMAATEIAENICGMDVDCDSDEMIWYRCKF